MNLENYVELASRSENKDFSKIAGRLNDESIRLLHGTLGIGTESGELQDALKKYLIYGKDLDRDNIIEESGDLLWYIALVCSAMNVTLEEVCQKNIAKLAIRYPDKFSEADAIGRADKTE
jgi:NTP pyrophosphatase (non-canonical NTP hydrolase)